MRVFAFQASFTLGTCDFCHQHEQQVGELWLTVPMFGRRAYVSCWDCYLLGRYQLGSWAAIKAAVDSVSIAT